MTLGVLVYAEYNYYIGFGIRMGVHRLRAKSRMRHAGCEVERRLGEGGDVMEEEGVLLLMPLCFFFIFILIFCFWFLIHLYILWVHLILIGISESIEILELFEAATVL